MPVQLSSLFLWLSFFAIAFMIVSVIGSILIILFNFSSTIRNFYLPIKCAFVWTLLHLIFVGYWSFIIFSSKESDAPDAWLLLYGADYPISLVIHFVNNVAKGTGTVRAWIYDYFAPLFVFGILGSLQYGFFGFVIGKVVSKFLK